MVHSTLHESALLWLDALLHHMLLSHHCHIHLLLRLHLRLELMLHHWHCHCWCWLVSDLLLLLLFLGAQMPWHAWEDSLVVAGCADAHCVVFVTPY